MNEDRFDLSLRERVTLDLTGCGSRRDVYRELRRKMAWKNWYGENLDALWDILTGLPCRGDDFVILRLRRYAGSSNEPDGRLTKYVDQVCSVFQQAQEEGCLTVRVQYAPEESPAPSAEASEQL